MLLRNHTAHPWPCRQSCHPTGLGDTGRTSPSQRYRPALDGGRVNEAFGYVVNWDLLPQAAIADLTLMPGSNPLYGLNTLGAAIVLRTKSGTTHPGATIEAYGGSFGRISGQFEAGRKFDDGLHVFAAGTWFNENGWRDHSPSTVD